MNLIDDLLHQASTLVKRGYPESTARKIASGELPMDEASRMARADQQRFLTDAYHATDRDITGFDKSGQPRMAAGRPDQSLGGNWFTSSADNASANYASDPYPPPMHAEVGQNIIPARLRLDDVATYDDPTGSPLLRSGAIKREKRKKVAERPDGVTFISGNGVEDTFVSDPANIRSSLSAAFDPDNVGKPNILGSLAAPTTAGALGAGMLMSPDEAMAGMQGEGLLGGIDTALGMAADTGQFAYGGGNALGSAIMGRDATDAFTEATQDPIYNANSRTSDAIRNLMSETTGALMDYKPPLRDQTIGQELGQGIGWLSETARPWLEENVGEYATNLLEGAGLAGMAVLGGKGKKATPDGFDDRFLYGTNAGKERLGERDRANALTLGIEDTSVRPPTTSLVDYEGQPFMTTMSDRTSAAGRLTDINGRQLSQPVDLQGGKDYMFNNPGQVWASDPRVVGKLMKEAQRVRGETGQDPLLIPWRMAPSGGDFSHMTSDTLLNYGRDNLSSTGRKAADAEIRKFVPDWKGIDDPLSNQQINNMTGPVRNRVRIALDKQRGEGGLSITEARLATTDPTQLDAPEMYGSRIGRVNTSKDIIPESGHNTYDAGLPGEGLGILSGEVPIYSLMPELQREMAQYGPRDVPGGVVNPYDPAGRDRRKFEMKPYSGILSAEVLRSLGF